MTEQTQLSQTGTVVLKTPESAPKSSETRMDTRSRRGAGLGANWVAGQAITEDMHVAACKVLSRAHGLAGLPQRMLDAMLSAAPQPPASPAPSLTQAGWMPIESAPKDDSVLLYAPPAPIYAGRKRLGLLGEPQQDVHAWRCDSSGRFANPTHWMPLPQSPKDQG